MKKSKIKLNILLLLLAVLISSFPLNALAAEGQTTIIYLDNIKSTYQIGETLKFRISTSNPNGGYLTQAYCGFGYNASTMQLISETDTPDHVWVKSSTPQKWLTSKEIEFKVIHDGQIYFIAGAYSGAGVIQGYAADGSRVPCTRASVVYKAGTGIYTPTSDCNAKSITVYDDDTGEEIKFNRSFDKHITEYFLYTSDTIKKVRIEAEPELEQDKVVLPEDLYIISGDNIINVGIQAVDGERKDYLFHIIKPDTPVEIEDIVITDNFGNNIEYEFDPNKFEYDIDVAENVTSLTYSAVKKGTAEVECPENAPVSTGYNLMYVTAKTTTDERKYEYFVFRQFPELCLSSLVVEASDGTVPPFDREFDPEITEYTLAVTSDVQSVSITYTLGSEGISVKEDYSQPYKLEHGENRIPITVTDGTDEKVYTVTVIRDDALVIKESEEDSGPEVNNKEFTKYEHKDLKKFAIIGLGTLGIGIAIAVIFAGKSRRKYKESAEGISDKEEKEREKRLKKLEKENGKRSKER